MRKVFCLLFVFLPLSANCESLTLDEAISKALVNSPQIVIAQQKVAQAEDNLEYARKRFNPNVSIHAGYNPFTEKETFGIQLSQDLDSFIFGNKHKVIQAEVNLKISQQELILVKQKLIQEIIDAYFNLQIYRESLRLKKELFKVQRISYLFAKNQYEIGKISLDSFLSVKKRLGQARFELIKAKYGFKKIKFILEQLIPSSRPCRVVGRIGKDEG